MFDILAGWPAHQVIELAGVCLGCLTAIVWGIAIFWCWVRRKEIEANLIRDMLQRGLSVDEIARLVRTPGSPSLTQTATDQRELDANLASLMIQNDIDAATIEQALRIYQQTDPAIKNAVHDSI